MKALVAGIGNIFFGDDGFGVEVATRMSGRPMPEGVWLAEYGIRGIHLAYELLDGYDTLVLVDALPMGEEPGTVALIEVDLDDAGAVEHETGQPTLDAHSMSPATVLGHLSRLGGRLDRVLVVGCQPAVLEEGIGLSPDVEDAVPLGIDLVEKTIADLHAGVEA